MKVELDSDEVWGLVSLIVARVADEAGLPKADKAKMRRWRSDEMRPGSDANHLLVRKINEDLAKATANKERSQLRKPDWR